MLLLVYQWPATGTPAGAWPGSRRPSRPPTGGGGDWTGAVNYGRARPRLRSGCALMAGAVVLERRTMRRLGSRPRVDGPEASLVVARHAPEFAAGPVGTAQPEGTRAQRRGPYARAAADPRARTRRSQTVYLVRRAAVTTAVAATTRRFAPVRIWPRLPGAVRDALAHRYPRRRYARPWLARPADVPQRIGHRALGADRPSPASSAGRRQARPPCRRPR